MTQSKVRRLILLPVLRHVICPLSPWSVHCPPKIRSSRSNAQQRTRPTPNEEESPGIWRHPFSHLSHLHEPLYPCFEKSCLCYRLPVLVAGIYTSQGFWHVPSHEESLLWSKFRKVTLGITGFWHAFMGSLAHCSVNCLLRNLTKELECAFHWDTTIDLFCFTLQEYMPLPPGEEEENKTEENAEPKLQFSCVECLIFTFHQLAKKVV